MVLIASRLLVQVGLASIYIRNIISNIKLLVNWS